MGGELIMLGGACILILFSGPGWGRGYLLLGCSLVLGIGLVEGSDFVVKQYPAHMISKFSIFWLKPFHSGNKVQFNNNTDIVA